jgi:hypothetical protein
MYSTVDKERVTIPMAESSLTFVYLLDCFADACTQFRQLSLQLYARSRQWIEKEIYKIITKRPSISGSRFRVNCSTLSVSSRVITNPQT